MGCRDRTGTTGPEDELQDKIRRVGSSFMPPETCAASAPTVGASPGTDTSIVDELVWSGRERCTTNFRISKMIL